MTQSTSKATLYGLGVGIFFGAALEKSKVYLPQVVRGQLLFQSWTMFKMFLMATAVGLIVTAILEHFGYIKRVAKAQVLGLGLLKGHGGNVLGGLILGVGMGIAGACPGTVLAQLGSGIPSAKIVLAGGLAAAFAFGLVHRVLTDTTKGRFFAKQDSILIDQWLGKSRMFEVSILLSIALGLVVFLLEYTFPWYGETAKVLGTSFHEGHGATATAWSPVYGGVIIGLLQIPAIMLMGHHLGASGSYVTLIAQIARSIHKSNDHLFPYFATFSGFSDYAQLGSVTGIVIGSFLSSTLSNSPVPVDTSNNSALAYFIGGFLLLFGARLAGGCTSGHGISGIAKLSLASIITVCSMFAGGIIVTNLLYI